MLKFYPGNTCEQGTVLRTGDGDISEFCVHTAILVSAFFFFFFFDTGFYYVAEAGLNLPSSCLSLLSAEVTGLQKKKKKKKKKKNTNKKTHTHTHK